MLEGKAEVRDIRDILHDRWEACWRVLEGGCCLGS